MGKTFCGLTAYAAIGTVVVVLAVFVGRQSDRLGKLEEAIWGESRAPSDEEVVDQAAEISGYDYDSVKVIVGLHPVIAPFVQGLFADGVINRRELEHINQAFLDHEALERNSRNIDDAKGELRKRLNPC